MSSVQWLFTIWKRNKKDGYSTKWLLGKMFELLDFLFLNSSNLESIILAITIWTT